jgi:hypothetical protein
MDPRLNTHTNNFHCSISCPVFWRRNATVKELIDQDSKWWNRELIEIFFSNAEVDVINKLPVSCSCQKDVLIWRGTTSGDFSIRNAYHMEKERQDLIRGSVLLDILAVRFGRIIWKLNVPNDVKMFLWRACHNLLPTKVNLLRRGIVDSSVCPIYDLECESLVHILWSCPLVSDVWVQAKKSFRNSFYANMIFFSL